MKKLIFGCLFLFSFASIFAQKITRGAQNTSQQEIFMQKAHTIANYLTATLAANQKDLEEENAIPLSHTAETFQYMPIKGLSLLKKIDSEEDEDAILYYSLSAEE